MAGFERNVVRERTMAGLKTARARGSKGVRKPVMNHRKMAPDSERPPGYKTPTAQVCGAVGVSSATLHRYLLFNGMPNVERAKRGH